jgi:hypothetical protein
MDLLAGDAILALFLFSVALAELLEVARDDGLGVEYHGVGPVVDAYLPESIEDLFDRARRQGKGDNGGRLGAARLVGEYVVDPLLVQDLENGCSLAGRDRDLHQTHAQSLRRSV